eukprot:scaffold141465_cov26-Tisochrysis_lutea.AAC.4
MPARLPSCGRCAQDLRCATSAGDWWLNWPSALDMLSAWPAHAILDTLRVRDAPCSRPGRGPLSRCRFGGWGAISKVE